MQKVLRSFIHEKYPLDLRVDLDIISRRRDIVGEEKAQEILKGLKKYGIGDVAKLGLGTNRYGIKLDGYVNKLAIDRDGKVDNRKEFKMAKLIFPKVPKTYEVTENGVILIAEYVQPMDSFSEMLRYADQIKETLQELSSMFLIGDAGISPKNYGNWGVRVGTKEVVCLDFAYIYDVTSDIFICRHCKANAMLVPTKDFVDLICPNPTCGKKTTFEDLRARISNEYHEKQIGDLSEEGYLMTSSNVLTELTEERSNYLVKMRPKTKVKRSIYLFEDQEQPPIDEEDQSVPLQENEYIKEDDEMRENKVVIRGTAGVPVDSKEFAGITIDTRGILNKNTPVKINPDGAVTQVTVNVNQKPANQQSQPNVVFTAQIDPNADAKVRNNKPLFANTFIENSGRAISVIASKIVDNLKAKNYFGIFKIYLDESKSDNEDVFWSNFQSCVFHSLVRFLEFEKVKIPPKNEGEKTKIRYRAVADIVNSTDYFAAPTLIFIERVFNTKTVNQTNDVSEMFDAYDFIYKDCGAIQVEWIDVLREVIKERIDINPAGITSLTNMVQDTWCKVTNDGDEEDEEYEDNGSEESEEEEYTEDAIEYINDTEDFGNEESSEVDFNDDYDSDDGDSEAGEEGEEYDPEYDYSDSEHLSVEVFPNGEGDVIKINHDNSFGEISIPIYTNLDNVNMTSVGLADYYEENGNWNWLIHMTPDFTFTTKDPIKYINKSDEQEPSEDQIRVVILNHSDGEYVMGIYIITGIYIADDDFNLYPNFGSDLLEKINMVICHELDGSSISHLSTTLSRPDVFHSEDEVYPYIIVDDDDSDDENGDEGEESEEEEYGEEDDGDDVEQLDTSESSEAEDAAVAVMMEQSVDLLEETVEEDQTDNNANKTPRDDKGRFVKREKTGTLEPVRRNKNKKNRDKDADRDIDFDLR